MATETSPPVGPAEEGLWLLQDLAQGLGVSNLAMRLCLPRRVDGDVLARSMACLVRRHPVLRSTFPLVDGSITRGEWRSATVVEPLSVDNGPDLRSAFRRAAGAAFDLESGPLIRLTYCPRSDGTTVMALVVHHLIADGNALRVLVEELLECITSLQTSGALPDLPPPPLWTPPPAPAPESVSYWQEHVRGYQPAGATLDATKPAVDVPSFEAGRVTRRLSSPATRAVRALRRRLRASDHIILLSAYYIDLIRHGARTDLVVGMLTSTRGPDERLGVGFRVNTVPLRLTVGSAASFRDVVMATRTAMLASLPHIGVPYEALLRERVTFAEPGDWWRSRLFRHLFNFRLVDSVDINTHGRASVEEIHHGLGQHDLELTLERHGNDLIAKLAYGADAHDESFAEALLARFEHILAIAHEHSDVPILDYDLRTEHDIAVVAAANETAQTWHPPDMLLEQVMARAAEDPDAIAVVGGDKAVAYEQLMWAAEATRDQLVRANVSPGDVVALAARRSARTAAAVLGIWAAGAAYFPIDPTHPTHRLAFRLEELGCRVVVNTTDLDAGLVSGRTAIRTPEPTQCAPAGPLRPAPPGADDLAYVIYTSGSTGQPKGVRLTHRNLTNVVNDFRALLAADCRTTGLWLTTFSFDISALELLLPLAAGGTVVVAEDDIRASPQAVLALVEQHGIDVIQATPTSWRLFGPVAAGRLRDKRILCGGEPLSRDLAEILVATGAQVYNVYGPTETTIWSTVAAVVRATGAPVSVGRPLANTRVEVLDGRNRPLPPYVKGELCIAGAGVADGYWRRPHLSTERFVSIDGIGRCYRTGDTASWTAEGTLLLHGRTDRQVKIRGHRIELGEIEQALSSHPHVAGAAVVVHPAGDEGRLVAYVEPAGATLTAEAVWRHTTEQLPAYALPEHIVVLDGLPTTPNGKVDVSALSRRVRQDVGRSIPPTETSTAVDDGRLGVLIEVWRSVLGRSAVDRDTHFFLSGGNSLLALKLIAEVHRATNHHIRLMTLFSAPTPARLAAALEPAFGVPFTTAEMRHAEPAR